MGVQANISINAFPRQGRHVNKPVRVCFHHDTDSVINGTVVRDDIEEPFLTIIKLEDNRYVLGTECQYALR